MGMTERSDELPDNVDELKAMTLAIAARAEANVGAARSEVLKLKAEVNDLAQANAMAKAEIARLTSILKTLPRGRFGKRSEKLGADEAKQQSFVFEEVETGLGEIDARLAAKSCAKPRKTQRDKPRFPSHLERVEEVVEPEIPPAFEGQERVKIGEDESFRLDVVRARFRLIVTIRPKYAYKEPTAILQAPAPEHIVEAGLPTEAQLVQVAVSKYADGLPLYRQEAIYARDGVELGRSLMAQWMGAVGFHLEQLAAHVLARIREGERIFADETTLPTLDPGPFDWLRGQEQNRLALGLCARRHAIRWNRAADGRLSVRGQPVWRLRRATSRRLPRHRAMRRLFRISQARERSARQRSAAGRMLGTPAASLLRLARQRRVGRRDRNGRADEAVVAVEDGVRGQLPEARRAVRRATSVGIVQALFDLWERELARISGKSKLAEAIRYTRSHRAKLLLFLEDGRVEIDSNIVERAIRPRALTRKNSLFAGSVGGGRTWASIATMLQTCKMNGVDPYAWAKLTLERIANRWPNNDIKALVPWNFKPIH
jgi:transposase